MLGQRRRQLASIQPTLAQRGPGVVVSTTACHTRSPGSSSAPGILILRKHNVSSPPTRKDFLFWGTYL